MVLQRLIKNNNIKKSKLHRPLRFIIFIWQNCAIWQLLIVLLVAIEMNASLNATETDSEGKNQEGSPIQCGLIHLIKWKCICYIRKHFRCELAMASLSHHLTGAVDRTIMSSLQTAALMISLFPVHKHQHHLLFGWNWGVELSQHHYGYSFHSTHRTDIYWTMRRYLLWQSNNISPESLTLSLKL